MKKILSCVLLLLVAIAFAGCNKKISDTPSDNSNNGNQMASTSMNGNGTENYRMSSANQIVEKLEVYYFHRTSRCYSCKTIGRYVRETMEQKYGKQIKGGTIDFRELNVELPENMEIARKYQASGSALYINKIMDGKDNIEQDADVWRLLGNEAQFKSHLENKINSYLGI